VIAPDDLTIPTLEKLRAAAYLLRDGCNRALSLEASGAEQVCKAGALIAKLLGITEGIAGTGVDPSSVPLIDVAASDAAETLDLEPGAADGED